MTPLREIIAKVHHASAVICLLLFPASILVLDHVYGVLFVLATTLGMLLLVGNVRRLGPSNDDEKSFFISLTLLGVTSVVTSLKAKVARLSSDADWSLDRALRVVLPTPRPLTL